MSAPGESITTAEVMQALSLSGGWTYGFKVITDRRVGASGLTKGKSAGMIIADTLPELLRNIATLAEEGDGTLESIAASMRKVQA